MNHFRLSSILFSLIIPLMCLGQTPDTWRSLGAFPEWPFPYSRHEHASIALNGNFYVIGGRGNKPVQIYDPVQQAWKDGAEPPLEIHHMQLATVNDLIYVVGAFTGGFPHETPISNIYIYNPSTDQWTKGAEIPNNRRRGAAGAVVHNNKIYVVCGIIDGHSSGWVNYMDVYDPSNNSWTPLSNAPRARDHFHASVVGDKIYVAGGRRSGADGTFNATVGEVDVYDINTNTWSTFGQAIPTKRAGCSAVSNGYEVIIIGGESGNQFEAHDEVEALDTRDGSWRTLAPMDQGRHGMQAFLYDEEIYVISGSIERGANELTRDDENFIEVYTPEKLQTSIPPSLNPQISIAPNPARPGGSLKITINDFHINGSQFQLRILNLIGQEVWKGNINPIQHLAEIQLPNSIKPAAYLLEISNGRKKLLKKLVVR